MAIQDTLKKKMMLMPMHPYLLSTTGCFMGRNGKGRKSVRHSPSSSLRNTFTMQKTGCSQSLQMRYRLFMVSLSCNSLYPLLHAFIYLSLHKFNVLDLNQPHPGRDNDITDELFSHIIWTCAGIRPYCNYVCGT